jgi:hypothetical protein
MQKAYIKLSRISTRNRDSSVGIASGYQLDGSGVGVRDPVGSRIFSSSRRPDRIWNHIKGTGGLSQEDKASEA